MMTVVCCNRYYVVGSFYANNRDEAMRLCQNHQDGDYVNIIMEDGREIGNSVDGWAESKTEAIYDAATMTGMYDGW